MAATSSTSASSTAAPGSSSSSISSSAPPAAVLPSLPPLDFTGEWILDRDRSDSLEAAVEYHGYNRLLKSAVLSMIPSQIIVHDPVHRTITITVVTPMKNAVENLQLDGVERTLDFPYPRGRVPTTAFVRDDGRALVSLYRVAKHATDIERTDRHLLSMDTMLLEMTTLRGTIHLPTSLDTSHMNVLFKIRRMFKRVKPAEPHVQAAFGAHLMALSARRRLSVDTSGGGMDDGNGTTVARHKSRTTTNGRNGHHRGGTGKPSQQRNGNTSNGANNGDDSDTDTDEHAAWSTGACCVRGCRRAFRLCCPRLSAADTSLLYPRTRKAIILANAKRAPQASDVAAALVSSSSTSMDMSSSMPNLLRGLTLSPKDAGAPLSSLRSPHLPTKVDPLITSLHKLETQAARRARRTMSKLDFLFVLLLIICMIGSHVIKQYFNE